MVEFYLHKFKKQKTNLDFSWNVGEKWKGEVWNAIESTQYCVIHRCLQAFFSQLLKSGHVPHGDEESSGFIRPVLFQDHQSWEAGLIVLPSYLQKWRSDIAFFGLIDSFSLFLSPQSLLQNYLCSMSLCISLLVILVQKWLHFISTKLIPKITRFL